MVSSGGGDPPCVSSGVGCRFASGRRLALVRRFPVVRRFDVARRFAVVRRFAVARRFTGLRFFRDERDVAARFLRFAICCLLSGQTL